MSIERQNRLNRRYYNIPWHQQLQDRFWMWVDGAVSVALFIYMFFETERARTGIELHRRDYQRVQSQREMLERCFALASLAEQGDCE